MESDETYFARRAKEERAAAERSDDPFAQGIHLEIAEAYELRSVSADPAAAIAAAAAAEAARTQAGG